MTRRLCRVARACHAAVLWALLITYVVNSPVSADMPRTDSDRGAQRPVTLRFVAWKADHPRAWEEAFAQFSAQHPHISIVRELAPHSSTAYHDLLTQKLKNHDATVDLFFMDIVWVPEFASAGWVLPLDDLFPAEEQQAFLPAALETARYNEHVYGVPSRIDSGMLFYRADLLAKYGFNPPQTWSELITQAGVVVQGEQETHPALHGYSGQFKQYEGLVCSMMEFIGSSGGRLLTADLQASLLSTPATLSAVEFVREQIVGKVASRAVLTYQEPESVVPFIQGNAIFHRNWPYTWEVANDPRRSRVAGKVGVAPLPAMTNRGPVTALGGWLYAISPYSRHRQEAWEFIRFISSAPRQRHFALAAGIAPSRTAVLEEEQVLHANPHFQAQRAMFHNATARPRTPLYPAISNILQRYFSKALAYRDVDLPAEAAKADRQINQLLELGQRAR